MRVVFKVLRWLLMAVALIQILGGIGTLIAPAPTLSIVKQELAVERIDLPESVTQETINQNDSKQKQGAAAVLVLWVFILSITIYFELKSEKKRKPSDDKTSSTKK